MNETLYCKLRYRKGEMRGRLYSIVVGALAFWLPAISAYAIFRENVGLLWQNILPILGLIGLAIIDWIRLKRVLRWNWVLAGLYILGPISIVTEQLFTGAVPPWKQSLGSMFFELAICLLPPMTILLSPESSQIFPVLAATIALPVFAIFGRGRGSRSLL